MTKDNTISAMQAEIYQTAVEHGWWEDPNYNIPEKICLMHSELSEALEEYRANKADHYLVDGKPEGITVELADCIIRILDLAGKAGWDMEAIIREKMEYNRTRSYRHGGKKA